MINSLHNRHAGEECAVLLNGPSLDFHDLTKIDCITIGVNRSWMLHASDYHIAIDDSHWKAKGSPLMNPAGPMLITGMDGPAHALKVPILDEKPPELGPLQQFRPPFGWSWDLEEGAYLCGSISLFALRVAVYMGFPTIYLLGFDLCAYNGYSKFKKHPESYRAYRGERWEPRQRELMASVVMELRKEKCHAHGKSTVWIWNLSPITKCEELPRKTFEEVFIERKGRKAGHGNPEHVEKADARANKGSRDRRSSVDAKKGRGRKRGRRR